MNLPDLSVVIPTLNSRQLLEPVLPQMREWSREVGEIIVVDSHSTDGTVELLRGALDASNIQFHTHPPGLYASWNFGISQATRKYLHIATAGDAISLAALRYLISVADSSAADVVVAPPLFVDEAGNPVPDPDWPIFQILNSQPDQQEILLANQELACVALFHCRPPLRYNCWLGSSASNLYRTQLLQAHPFPTNAGHFGDTLFALEQAWHIKAVFCRKRCGTFILHNHTDLTSPEKRKWLSDVFEGAWQESFSRLLKEMALPDQAAGLINLLLADMKLSGEMVEQLRDKLCSETEKKKQLRAKLESLKTKNRDKAKHGSHAPRLIHQLLAKLGIR